jgi:DNA (cytosine-5)-methyltransferase 1
MANYPVSDDRFHWNVTFLEGAPYRNEVDLFVGGSPCQSFSLVGKQMGLSDTRGTLFYEYARLVSEIKPKCFIYENVRALLSNDGGKTWATISKIFTDLGYDWQYQVLNSKDYGMPQNRERVFVVGFRKDLKVGDSFQFPKPVELTRTMQDFLLDVVPGKYYLPEKGVEFVLDEGNLTKRYTQIDGTLQSCQKKKEAAMRCLYFENGICCESDCVGVDDLEVYFRDSFRYHVGKSASEKSVRQYLSHQPVIVHDRALIHYWECA